MLSKCIIILLTRAWNLELLTTLFYIVKLGFVKEIYIIFLIFALNNVLCVLVRAEEGLTCTLNLCFCKNKKTNITRFHLKIIILQPLKIAVYFIGVLT